MRARRSRFCRTPTSSSTPGSGTSISGRAYLEVEGAETRADSEFDDCLKRRGEAIWRCSSMRSRLTATFPSCITTRASARAEDRDDRLSGLVQTVSRDSR